MHILKKLTSQTKNPAIENLTGITISVFFLSILIITSTLIIAFIIFAKDYQKSAWQNLIKEHMERYPAMQPDDVYKLVYQGTFGPAHLGADSSKILTYLNSELASIEADSNADYFEPVSPSQKYVRINLKYLKLMQGNPDLLVRAILKSSTASADSELIAKRWKWVEEMVADGKLPFESAEFQAFSDNIKSLGFPVIHHSEQFIKTYNPAYRVIKKKFLSILAIKPRYSEL